MMDMDDALGQENLKTTLNRRPGSGHNPPDSKPDGEPGGHHHAGSNPYLTAGTGIKSPLPSLSAEDAGRTVAAGGRRIAHDNALLKRRTTITAGSTADHRGAHGALKGEWSCPTQEVHKQSAQAISVAAQARTNLRDPAFGEGYEPAQSERSWRRPALLKAAAVVLAVLTILPQCERCGQFKH